MLKIHFLQRKIKLIQEDLALLEQIKVNPQKNKTVQEVATERLLERIITRAIDINRHIIAEMGNGSESVRTYEDTFLHLSDFNIYPEKFAKLIAPSAGLRNIIVHEYDEIDTKILRKSTDEALKEYAQYCNYLLTFIKKSSR